MVTLGFAVGHDHAADDGREFSFDAEETFEKGCCCFDASSFVGCVGFDIVAIGGIETEAVVVIVALLPHLFAKANCIQITSVREFSSPFQNDQYFSHLATTTISLKAIPFQHFQLKFPGQSVEMPSRLKHYLHLQIILEQRMALIQLRNDRNRDIEEASQATPIFEFYLILTGIFKELQKPRIRGLDLQFQLRRAVSMPKDGDNRPQFLYFREEVIKRRLIGVLIFPCVEAFQQRVVVVAAWVEVVHDLLFEDGRAVLPVLGVALHEGPAIDIADVGAAIGPKEVEPANFLLKLLNYLVADEFLVRSKDDRIPHFLPLLIALHHAVQSRRSPRLGVHVVRPNRVHLNIEGVGGQELFVDVIAIPSD